MNQERRAAHRAEMDTRNTRTNVVWSLEAEDAAADILENWKVQGQVRP